MSTSSEEDHPKAQPTPVIISGSASQQALPAHAQPTYIMYAPSVPGLVQGAFCPVPSSTTGTMPVMPGTSPIFLTPVASPTTASTPFAVSQLGAGSVYISPYGHAQLMPSPPAGYPIPAQVPSYAYNIMSVQKKETTSSTSPTRRRSSGSFSPKVTSPLFVTATTSAEERAESKQPSSAADDTPSKELQQKGVATVLQGPDGTYYISSASIQAPTVLPPGAPSSAAILSRIISRKAPKNSQQVSGPKNSSLEKLLTSGTSAEASAPDTDRDPDFGMYSQLKNEPHFVSFYRFFKASDKSSHLRIRLLNTEGDSILKWIEVTRQASHIDANIGPVDVARILISSHGICKLQLIFPYFKAIYTRFMPTNQEEADALLGELSAHHVLCPGLPEYGDKFNVLGYHPAHVRVLETPFLHRYDHEKCPIWHIPSNLFSKSGHMLHNMCKHCKYLHNNLVRLATKACEVDPAQKESWTDPSSHRPLAYMSTAEKEERYRKLRQERTQLLNKLKLYEEKLGITGKLKLFATSGRATYPPALKAVLGKILYGFKGYAWVELGTCICCGVNVLLPLLRKMGHYGSTC